MTTRTNLDGVTAPGPVTRPYPRTAHPDWCAQGHRCGLGEHRSDPLTVTIPGAGSLVLTRVADTRGRQWAEVRGQIQLGTNEQRARARLARLLDTLTRQMRTGARR